MNLGKHISDRRWWNLDDPIGHVRAADVIILGPVLIGSLYMVDEEFSRFGQKLKTYIYCKIASLETTQTN